MRRPALLLAVPLLLAGCTGTGPDPAREPSDLDLITPGTWEVTASTDRILAWAHNAQRQQVTVQWSLEGRDGEPLPEEWTVTFEPAQATLAPDGTKQQQGGRTLYPDWTWTLITVQVAEGAAGGSHALRLVAGPIAANVTVEVADARDGRVTGPGDDVRVEYRGTFTDDGEEFDSGQFPTTLGSGQTVPGFDYGLMGLEVGEEASLVVPPALAYGYDNDPAGRYGKFNGRSLTFDVKILSIDA